MTTSFPVTTGQRFRHASALASELDKADVAHAVCTAAGPVPGARVI